MTTVYNDQTAVELAASASEAIRGINHLTRDAGSLRYPSEVYQALGSLTEMVGRLPQALQQIEALLQKWIEAGDVSIDAGEFSGDPVAAVTAASVYLMGEAMPALTELHSSLQRVQATLAYASHTGPSDTDDED